MKGAAVPVSCTNAARCNRLTMWQKEMVAMSVMNGGRLRYEWWP